MLLACIALPSADRADAGNDKSCGGDADAGKPEQLRHVSAGLFCASLGSFIGLFWHAYLLARKPEQLRSSWALNIESEPDDGVP